jgi:hypothetical protein
MIHRIIMTKHIAWLAVLVITVSGGQAQLLHVDARFGDDGNRGSEAKPLRTIEQAATFVNAGTESGPATVVIAPGIYSLNRCVTISDRRRFTEKERVTIRASILPGDPRWKPESMPILMSVENPRETARSNMPRETYSLKIQTSHVTIQGLKFLGNPSHRNWHCCIERIGNDLDDLVVTQCMFMGSRDTAVIYCAALATGDRFVVEHCIFSGCHACTVVWDGLDGISGTGCAMRYCVVEDALISAVWTCQTAEDFAFHHNVIANSAFVWMRNAGDRQTYHLGDCVIIGNTHFSGYGRASGPTGPTGSEVSFERDNVTEKGHLVWASYEKTHLEKDSAGSDLGAGLFLETPTR